MRTAFLTLTATLAIGAQLASAQTTGGAPPTPPAPAAHIHVNTGDARSYYTNAWWIESPTGLVLIDAMCLRSDVAKLIAAMRSTGKPLEAVFISHPHADHFGGIAQLKAAYPKAAIIATAGTANGMQAIHDQALRPGGWLAALGDEYERTLHRPDRIVASGTTLNLAGLEFIITDYGMAEAENNSVIHVPALQALFTGDLTVASGAYYTGEGHSRLAMKALTRLPLDFPTVQLAYSGHYAPMPLRALAEQNLADLRFVRQAATLEFADSASRTANGGLNQDAMRRLIRTYASALRERGTYGLGPIAIAQMNVVGIVQEFMSDTTRPRVPDVQERLRVGMRPLRYLQGRWTGTQVPGDTTATTLPRSITIATDVAPVLGGAALEARMSAPGYLFVLTFSYDASQNRYRVSALDDMSGLLDIFEGTLDSAGVLTVDNVRPGTFYVNPKGAKVHTRMIFSPTEGGMFRLVVHESTNGGTTWQPSSRYDTTRRIVP